MATGDYKMRFEFNTLQELAIEYIESLSTPAGVLQHNKYMMIDRGAKMSESPLEDMFWHFMRKTDVDKWDAIEGQYKIGNRRLDALLVTNGRRIDIELDGKEFHQDERADRERDQSLILDWGVDEVIRIPYASMMFASHATFKILAAWHPSLSICSPGNVYSAAEASEELNKLEYRQTEYGHEEALDCLDTGAEVYDTATDGLAWALPFDAWRKRHRANPIKRLTREMRGIHSTGKAARAV
jgi:very-short-patch-repair endonuclease